MILYALICTEKQLIEDIGQGARDNHCQTIKLPYGCSKNLPPKNSTLKIRLDSCYKYLKKLSTSHPAFC